MGSGKKRHGRKPANGKSAVPETPSATATTGYPVLCLRYLRSGYGVDELTVGQRSDLLVRWAKRCRFTWSELNTHHRHGLGWEMLPEHQIKKNPPEELAQDKYMVLRYSGNQPLIGFRAGDVYHALWVEAKYGDVYNH